MRRHTRERIVELKSKTLLVCLRFSDESSVCLRIELSAHQFVCLLGALSTHDPVLGCTTMCRCCMRTCRPPPVRIIADAVDLYIYHPVHIYYYIYIPMVYVYITYIYHIYHIYLYIYISDIALLDS